MLTWLIEKEDNTRKNEQNKKKDNPSQNKIIYTLQQLIHANISRKIIFILLLHIINSYIKTNQNYRQCPFFTTSNTKLGELLLLSILHSKTRKMKTKLINYSHLFYKNIKWP